jgi:hypothetical protein
VHEKAPRKRTCPYRKLKFGNIDGAVRREQGWQQYGRWPELRARLEHPCPTTSAFYIHCNSSGSCVADPEMALAEDDDMVEALSSD